LYLLAPIAIAAWRLPSSMFVSAVLSGTMLLFVAMTMPAGWPFWFGAWAIGVLAHRMLAKGPVPASAGAAGLAACVGAMISSRTGHLPLIATDVAIALGLALAISCRSIVMLSIAPKAMQAGAQFSYSLYLIHLPVAVTVGALLEKLGWPSVLSQPAGELTPHSQ
jgi:peptidoglycan/LPS O-acetylase OafA/YrhL